MLKKRAFLSVMLTSLFSSNGYCDELFNGLATRTDNSHNTFIKDLAESASTIKTATFTVAVNAKSFSDEILTVRTPDNTAITYYKKRLRVENGRQIWTGFRDKNATHDLMNNIVLVNNNGSIAASFRVDGQLYQIYPAKNNHAVVAKIDEGKIPVSPPGSTTSAIRTVTCPVHPPYQGDSGQKSTIRVAIVTTKESRQALSASDLTALTTVAFEEANLGAANSDVGINFVPAGILDANYSENGSYSTMLNEMRTSSGSELSKEIDNFRTKNRAHLAVMLLKDNSASGKGYNDATRSTAFSVIRYSYLTGTYTFAHEMGHNIGASHDLEQYENNQPQRLPCYRHGFKSEESSSASGWRTIMSYKCNTGSCSRINMYSNPRITYNGIAAGNAEFEDNARRLNERRETVAAFY
ncbi:hypothetical protein GWD52_12530 [Enterobacteriaceae bacterium 4M9]|nr:hypothetical protein [Enterobacteriaceae bacterium 4M9]